MSGWETLCEQQQNTGCSVDGCYAEHVLADARYVVPVPEGVSSVDAVPLTRPGVTTYKAVKVAGVRSAERVAVFGIGGLGHLELRYARIAGGFTVAVDVEDTKLEPALRLGADHTVNAATSDPVAEIQALGGADVAIALAASPRSFEQAFASLRRGGRLVRGGRPADGRLDLPVFDVVLRGI
ncbi:zinc-binding dehydrogenase [Umezawaea sp.]|uniref:zinc-binding dehydrogenase n=1 Tax=Umezawaea sp. TaxID=1955258 RepID=UPI002ED63677